MNPRVKAHVSMRPEENGGRHGPFCAGYRPHVVADGDDTYLGIYVTQPHEDNKIFPGEERVIEMELVYHPLVDYSRLTSGRHFLIKEGSKTVGEGHVL